ncbi:MAG: hypothetical protein AAFQ98_22105 [Bacteroidota bacterium]
MNTRYIIDNNLNINRLQFGSVSCPRSFRAAQAIVQDDLWGWISVRSSDRKIVESLG